MFMLTRVFKTVSVLFSILVLYGCGEIQLYPGPKLPHDQLAVLHTEFHWNLSYPEYHFDEAVIDGTSFRWRDVVTLPGPHTIGFHFCAVHGPYDCTTTEHFDEYGLKSCIESRDRDLRKGKKASDCPIYSYKTSTRKCTVRHKNWTCQGTVELKANIRYTLDIRGDVFGLFSSDDLHALSIPCPQYYEETEWITH